MKRSILFVCVILAMAFNQTGKAQPNEEAPQSGPTCGTEQAMAKMPSDLKSLTAAAAVAVQADELLLYINFNQNGSTVRQGFGNADTLTSSIISGIRFLPPPQLDQEKQDEIVRLVSDEFSPFNIRVTTDSAEFMAYPRLNKQMALISTVPAVIGHPSFVGGVSPFAGPGMRLPGDFAFVFSGQYGDDARDVAAVVAHESGHLLGLGHQHQFNDTCGFLFEYHAGLGSGPLSFKPLMGDGTGQGVSNWFAQACPSPLFGEQQNDYELINSQVTVRPDDFPDEPSEAVVDTSTIDGVLEQAGDVDFIKINFRNPGPVVIASDNIDLKVSIVNVGGRVMSESNDPAGTNAIVPSAKGMRYLKIEGAANDNMPAQFMTGTYHVSF